MADDWTAPEPEFEGTINDEWMPNNLPNTLVDLVTYEAALKDMRESPCTVMTFDKDRKVFVKYAWPAYASGKAVEVKNIETIISKHNLEVPFCLCTYREQGEEFSRPAELRCKDGVLMFVCRRHKRRCDYIGSHSITARLDKFDPLRAATFPLDVLSGKRGFSFRFALGELNEKLVHDFYLHHGYKPADRDRAAKGKAVARTGFSSGEASHFSNLHRIPRGAPSTSHRFNPGESSGATATVGLPPALMELVYALTSHGVAQVKLEEVTVACVKCRNVVYAPTKDFHACPK
ncbi:hypothetical protein AURDEDRAFT_124828 [Auricularia subglabra TFB-10046 SS5]|nr:hypothetical protein AURDEDRAFT_124828 [Auricularia subglabra TFB-10046 SS5]